MHPAVREANGGPPGASLDATRVGHAADEGDDACQACVKAFRELCDVVRRGGEERSGDGGVPWYGQWNDSSSVLGARGELGVVGRARARWRPAGFDAAG